MPDRRNARSARSSSGIDILIVFRSLAVGWGSGICDRFGLALPAVEVPERLVLLDRADVRTGLLQGPGRGRGRCVLRALEDSSERLIGRLAQTQHFLADLFDV